MHDGETSITVRLDHIASGPSGSTQQVVDMFSSSTGYSLELHDFNVIVRLNDHDEGEIYLRVLSCEVATVREEVRREREAFPNLPDLGVQQGVQKRVNMLREVRKASKENAHSSQRSSKSERTRGLAIDHADSLHGPMLSSSSENLVSQTLQFQTQLPIASQMSTSNPKKRVADDVALLGGVNLSAPIKPRQHVSTMADTVVSKKANLLALLHQQRSNSFARTPPATVYSPPKADPLAAKIPDVLDETPSLHENAPQLIRNAEPKELAALDDEPRLFAQQSRLVDDTRSFAAQLSQYTEMSNISQPSATITTPDSLRDTRSHSVRERQSAAISVQGDPHADMSQDNERKGIIGRHTRSFDFVETFKSIVAKFEGNPSDIEEIVDLDEAMDPFVVGDVPDKQQLILYRPESVYSSNMSRPFPQGNIPIAVFRRFLAGLKEARSETGTAHRRLTTITTVQNKTVEDDDEDDEDALSGWDASSPVRSRVVESLSPRNSLETRPSGLSSPSQISRDGLSPKSKNTATRLVGKDFLPLDSSAPAPNFPSSSPSSSPRSPAGRPTYSDELEDVFPSMQNTLSIGLRDPDLPRQPQQAGILQPRNSSPVAHVSAARRDSQSSDIEMETPQALPTPTPMSITSSRSRTSNDDSRQMRRLQSTGSASSKRARQDVSTLQTPVLSKFQASMQAFSASQPSPYSTATTSTTATRYHAASQQPRQHSLSIISATSDRLGERQHSSWNSHFSVTPVPTLDSLQNSPVQLVPGTFDSSDRRAFNRAPRAFAVDGNADSVPSATRKASTVTSESDTAVKGLDHVQSSSQKKSKKRPAVDEPSREPGSELVPKRNKFDFDRPSQVEDPIEANRRMRAEFVAQAKATLRNDAEPAKTSFANSETRKRPRGDRLSAENTPTAVKSASSILGKTLTSAERHTRTIPGTKDSEMDRHDEPMEDAEQERLSKRPKVYDTPQSVRHEMLSVAEPNKPNNSPVHASMITVNHRKLKPQHAMTGTTPQARTLGGVEVATLISDKSGLPGLVKSSVHALPAADEPLRGASRIFSDFQMAYPVYCGDIKHFQGLCRMIKRLNVSHGLLHRSLWDDFVIRHRRDYTLYMVQCLQNGEAVKAYEVYYQEDIEEPSYTLRVLTLQTLEEALTEVQPGEAGLPLQQRPLQQAAPPASGPVPANEPQSTRVGLARDLTEDSAAKSHSPKSVARSASPFREQPLHTGTVIKPSNASQSTLTVETSLSGPEAIDLTMESPADVTIQLAAPARLGSGSNHASSISKARDLSASSKAMKHGIAQSAAMKPDQVKKAKRKLNPESSPSSSAISSNAASFKSTATQPKGTGRKDAIAAKSTQPVIKPTRVPMKNTTAGPSAGTTQSPRDAVVSTAVHPVPPIEPKSKTNSTTSDAAQQRARACVSGNTPAMASPQTKTQTAQKNGPVKPAASGTTPGPTQLRNSNMVLPKPASATVAVGSTFSKPYSVNQCMICGASGHWMSNCPVSHGKMLAKEEARQAMVNATQKRAVRRDPNYDTSEVAPDVTVPPPEAVEPAGRPPRVPAISAHGYLSTPNNIPTGPRNPGPRNPGPSSGGQRSAQWRNKQQQSQARFPLR